MKATPCSISDVMVIEPRVLGDTRGFFYESFNQQAFNAATGIDLVFVQDNHSRSSQGVLRGLHYQLPPHAQGKLVRVVRGVVWDVVVDIRRGSATFGQWVAQELTEYSHKQMWIPPGFAHGFSVLSESADVVYKTTAYYAPESERGIAWDDPAIGIQWPALGMDWLLSERDRQLPKLCDAEVF
ncbi:MAG: dTDP-4-dehydrorhamnose 3,5-epimerase [Comamonas sp.]